MDQFTDGRRTMRTLVDALATLDTSQWDATCARAMVSVCPMEVPGRPSSVALVGPERPERFIMLPAANRFLARSTIGEQREYDITELDKAVVDANGNVELRDGRHVHAVEVIPVHLPEDLTREEKRDLHVILEALGDAEACDRSIYKHDKVNLNMFDYALLARLGSEGRLPCLKALYHKVRELTPEKPMSRQTMLRVMARSGLRPASRAPRARSRQ